MLISAVLSLELQDPLSHARSLVREMRPGYLDVVTLTSQFYWHWNLSRIMSAIDLVGEDLIIRDTGDFIFYGYKEYGVKSLDTPFKGRTLRPDGYSVLWAIVQ